MVSVFKKTLKGILTATDSFLFIFDADILITVSFIISLSRII